MPVLLNSFALESLPWPAVERHLQRDRRLIFPVGTCEQYGAHLPIGAGTRLAEALADDLSLEFGVLRAPTLGYGVNLSASRDFAGAVALRSKTLHRTLNELLAGWQKQGFSEFVLICGEAHDPHVEAVATASVPKARVRVVEPLTVDLSQFLDAAPRAQHAGEALTSILLHLHPELVRMEVADDVPLTGDDADSERDGRLISLPDTGSGTIGFARAASARKGEAMYRHILEKIRRRVFLADAAATEPDPHAAAGGS